MRCFNCDAEIVYGKPHEMTVNGEPQFWCAMCIEDYSAACWPEDTLGPRPPGMHQSTQKRTS
jgi:hypothetical protein